MPAERVQEHPDAVISAIAPRQHGLVTYAQLLAAGHSARRGRAPCSRGKAHTGWELRPSSATKVHVTVPTCGGRRPRRGIVVHRSSALAPLEVTTHRGIPVTTVARSLLDAAAVLTPSSLARAVERAEILALFDLAAIERSLALHPKHPGAKPLAAAVALYRDGEATRSELEAMLLALGDAHGLPRPLVNTRVEDEEVD
ncbi:MAG TPA: hypothetical protein VG474_02445, partial [Solirubrobacteraceae bacterium]|nr:hypothetical protein [Solirubrobacteraceae bacterium]